MKKIIVGIIIFLVISISIFYYFNNSKTEILNQNNLNQNTIPTEATTSEIIKTESVKKVLPILEKDFTVVEKQIGKIVSKEPVSKIKVFTLEELKAYDNQEKCFTVINEKVYDITKYLSVHPGGINNVLKVCGRDGTNIFMGKHTGDEKPNIILRSMQVGVIQN